MGVCGAAAGVGDIVGYTTDVSGGGGNVTLKPKHKIKEAFETASEAASSNKKRMTPAPKPPKSKKQKLERASDTTTAELSSAAVVEPFTAAAAAAAVEPPSSANDVNNDHHDIFRGSCLSFSRSSSVVYICVFFFIS
jgi:hypothetical protein